MLSTSDLAPSPGRELANVLAQWDQSPRPSAMRCPMSTADDGEAVARSVAKEVICAWLIRLFERPYTSAFDWSWS